MTPFDDAIKLVLENVRALGSAGVKLHDAWGLSAASDVRSEFPSPLFNNSQMDGFAVIAKDLLGASKENPITLDVAGDIPAGKISTAPLKSGSAMRIMTGAPLPAGADAVIAVEDTECSGANVKFFHAPEKGEFVRFAGEDIRQGETIIAKGEFLGAAHIMALASQGFEEVSAVKRAKVAIIATGDELAPPGTILSAGRIYNSSSPMLAASVKGAGAVPFDLGAVRDDAKAIAEKLCEAIGFDMILMTGGVSAGDYDLNRGVLSNMGWKEIFWKVAIKPGKPLAFGTLEGKPVFGLPGNPISTMNAFELFVRPAIRKMMGVSGADERRISAKLANDVRRDREREQFLLARLSFENGTALVAASSPQSSAHFKPALAANCIARIPAGEGAEPSGNTVEVWHLFRGPLRSA